MAAKTCHSRTWGGGGATRRARGPSPRLVTVTVSLTGSPTRRTLVASLGQANAKLPIAPVKPGNSPSGGSGRTFSSTGSDSSSVYWGRPPGMVAVPVMTIGPENWLPAVKPCAKTVSLPAAIGVRVVS